MTTHRMAAVLMGSTLAGAVALADPNYTVVGAAAGAVAGAVVANNVDGVSRIVAIPAGALLGGVIGNQINQKQKHNHQPDYSPKAIVPAQGAAAATPADPHPGVDLIKVSIQNSNGVRTDVPILRTAGKFVGPQGEQYDTLPTSDELKRRYGM